jgi:hypothetical protein
LKHCAEPHTAVEQRAEPYTTLRWMLSIKQY